MAKKRKSLENHFEAARIREEESREEVARLGESLKKAEEMRSKAIHRREIAERVLTNITRLRSLTDQENRVVANDLSSRRNKISIRYLTYMERDAVYNFLHFLNEPLEGPTENSWDRVIEIALEGIDNPEGDSVSPLQRIKDLTTEMYFRRIGPDAYTTLLRNAIELGYCTGWDRYSGLSPLDKLTDPMADPRLEEFGQYLKERLEYAKNNRRKGTLTVTHEIALEIYEKLDKLNAPISTLGLSDRLNNTLVSNRLAFISIGRLTDMSRGELSSYRGIGSKSLEEIERKLSKAGYSLAGRESAL